MKKRNIAFIFIFLFTFVGCLSKKEAVQLNEKVQLNSKEQISQAEISRKILKGKLASVQLKLHPPDTIGNQAVESVAFSNLDFLCQDSIIAKTVWEEEVAMKTTTQFQEINKKELSVFSLLSRVIIVAGVILILTFMVYFSLKSKLFFL